jgi:Mrp family chromosome partitioning ATPase
MDPTQQPASSAIPSDEAAAPRPQPSGGSLLSRLEPGASLARHKRLALSLFLLISCAGLPIAYVKGKPGYYTQAVVFISPRFIKNLQGDEEFQLQSNTQYREYVQQNVRTINRFDIVQETLKRLGGNGKRWWYRPGENDRRAAERLAAALMITPVPDTYQVTVGLDGDKPQGLAEIVNTLVDVYIAVQKSEEFYGVDSRLRTLQQEMDSLGKEMADTQTRRTELAQELGVSTFSESYINPYDQLLVSAKQALADARRQRITATEQFGVVDPARGTVAKQTLDAYALEMASKDPANTALLSSTNPRRAELTARLSGLSPEHPGRKALMQELAAIEADKQRNLKGLSAEYSQIVLEQRRAEALRAERIEKALAAEVAQQESRASWFTEKYQAGISLGQRIEQARKRQETVEERKRFLDLESRAPGFVRVFAKAQPADLPAKGGRTKLALLFGFAGLVIAILVPVAVDVVDPRLLIPSDAGRALGFEPLGWVPERKEGGEEFTWELILRLANRIDQERQTHGTRIWMFTAVKSGGGTTTLVNTLGRALTLLGVPVLSVEANAYRADGRFARNATGLGLSVLLRGHSTLSESIETADEEMPDHIPVGELDGSGHLPDIHRLMEILGEAVESYALVLVDIPPVLTSVDAEYLARRADCVVLVAEARHVSAPELKRAARALERIQPKAVACVLNRVHAADGRGFAQDARREFETGAPKPMPAWQQPWLWR